VSARLCLRIAVFAVFAVVQPTATPAQPVEALDAKAIYLKTVAAVNALPLPPYVEFTSQNDSYVQNAAVQDQLRIVMRVSDGYAFVELLRNQEGQPTPLARAQVVTDGHFPSSIYRLGDFPLADFGLRLGPQTRPGIFEDTGTPEPEPSGAPRPIASVKVIDIPYALVDLGDDSVNGRATYHLGMTPLRDPGHHVLRQMWVDKTTFLPLRYVAERFVDATAFKFRYLVTVNTALVAGHLVNIDADGHFDVHRALFFRYVGEGRWTIAGVAFPRNEPDWMFDPAIASAPVKL
jgi:hypothetical protein